MSPNAFVLNSVVPANGNNKSLKCGTKLCSKKIGQKIYLLKKVLLEKKVSKKTMFEKLEGMCKKCMDFFKA